MSEIPQFWKKGIQLVDGCIKVSPGCMHCWAELMTARFKRVPEVLTGDKFNGKVIFNMHLLEKAAKVKKPTVYAIWNDLYHEGVTDEQIDKVFGIMMAETQHTYLIVTKRPDQAQAYLSNPDIEGLWESAVNNHKGGNFALAGECKLND